MLHRYAASLSRSLHVDHFASRSPSTPTNRTHMATFSRLFDTGHLKMAANRSAAAVSSALTDPPSLPTWREVPTTIFEPAPWTEVESLPPVLYQSVIATGGSFRGGGAVITAIRGVQYAPAYSLPSCAHSPWLYSFCPALYCRFQS